MSLLQRPTMIEVDWLLKLSDCVCAEATLIEPPSYLTVSVMVMNITTMIAEKDSTSDVSSKARGRYRTRARRCK